MNKELDIVKLIEKNSITKLTSNYQSVFINKIKEIFDENEQSIFVGSFYCYLNYNSKTEFVIDFDSIWKWLGFSRKEECKRVLVKHFQENENYIINRKVYDENLAPQVLKFVNRLQQKTTNLYGTIIFIYYIIDKNNIKK